MIDFTRYPDNKLPLPQLKSYSVKRASSALKTKMDSGYQRKRRRFKNTPSIVSIKFLFSSSEFELFEGWYHNVLLEGQHWFNMPVKTAAGLVEHACRFSGDYAHKPLTQKLWQVTAKLEVNALQTISDDETISRIHDIDQPTEVVRDSLNATITDYVN